MSAPTTCSATIVGAVLDKVPAARPGRGRGRHHRLRPARRRAGLQHRPGRRPAGRARRGARRRPSTATARRRCRRSAWRPTPSRPGRATCSSPPASRCVSRYVNGDADSRSAQPEVRRRRGPHRRRGPTAADSWEPADGLPDIYIAMGQTAENVAAARGRVPPGDGRVRRAVPGPGRRVAGERLLRAGDHARSTLPDGTIVAKDDGPRPGHDGREAGRAQAGVPPRRRGHRGQRVPPQRRRRRGRGDERHQGRASSASRRWPGSSPAASAPSTPRSWASARSRRAGRRWRGPA